MGELTNLFSAYHAGDRAVFDRIFAIPEAVKILAASVPETGKGKDQSPLKPRDVYPPEPNKPRK